MPTLVLASTSPYRRALLERLGVPFEVRAPGVDESAYRHLPPGEMAGVLAEAKARAAAALAPQQPGQLVVGSDQCVVFEGEALGKPGSAAAAERQLTRLSGRAHALHTGLCLYAPGPERVWRAVDVHTLHMRPLSPAQIARYVARDQPLDCAGSYKLESLGVALFTRTSGEDSTAVVGLPLMRLAAWLAEAGLDVLDPPGPLGPSGSPEGDVN